MKKLLIFLFLCGCVAYTTPSREQWGNYLRGVSFADMTAEQKIAKKPILLGAGGRVITDGQKPETEYLEPDAFAKWYMENLEYELYNGLRKSGISVQRAGTDIVVILVRDAFMELNAPEISATGVDTLNIIANILRKYDATYVEISGYTDAMRDAGAARAMSLDMARRVAIYLSRNKIITARMFVTGRGASRPISDQTDMGRLMNRRVEIRLSPVR